MVTEFKITTVLCEACCHENHYFHNYDFTPKYQLKKMVLNFHEIFVVFIPMSFSSSVVNKSNTSSHFPIYDAGKKTLCKTSYMKDVIVPT